MKQIKCCRCQEDIPTTLKDAGFDEEEIHCFIEKKNAGKMREALCMLQSQREILVNDMHSVQRRLDCLDFLIYQMRKEQK